MFNSAKAEMLVGTSTVTAITGFGWTTDILPVISEIGVVAGSIVAVHGLCKLCYGYYKQWRYNKNGNH